MRFSQRVLSLLFVAVMVVGVLMISGAARADNSHATYCNNGTAGDASAPASGGSLTLGFISQCHDGLGRPLVNQVMLVFIPKQAGGTLGPTTPINTVASTDTTTLITYPLTHFATYTRSTSDMEDEVWILSPMPDTGFDSLDTTATWTSGGGDTLAVNMFLFIGAYIDTTTPIAHISTTEGTGTTISDSITSASTHVTLDTVQSPGAAPSAAYPAQTGLWSYSGNVNPGGSCAGDGDFACSPSPNGASQSMDWTLDASVPWFHVIIDMGWAAGSPPAPLNPTVDFEVRHAGSPVTETTPGVTIYPYVQLSGPTVPTGTVTFEWFSANGLCSGTPDATSAPITLSGGAADGSATFTQTTPSASVRVSFKMIYSGDTDYAAATACKDVGVHTVPTLAVTNFGGWTSDAAPPNDHTNVAYAGSTACGTGSTLVTYSSIGSGITGINRFLVFGIEYVKSTGVAGGADGVVISSVTVNGEPMARISQEFIFSFSSGSSGIHEVYTYSGSQIINGASIAMTFTAPVPSTVFCTGGVAEDDIFTNVNLGSPVRSHVSASHNGANADPTVAAIASSYDDTLYEFLSHDRGLSPPAGMAPASGQTNTVVHDNGILTPSNIDGCSSTNGHVSSCAVARDGTRQGQPSYTALWSSTPADATGQVWGLTAISIQGFALGGGNPGGPPPQPLPIPISCPGATEIALTDTRPEAANVVIYLWDWGDGTNTQTSSHSVTHNYTLPGTFTITMRAQDISGRIDTFQGTVDLSAPGCHILYGAQIIGPYLLALLIIAAFVLLIQLIFGKKGKFRLALGIMIIVLVAAVVIFIFFGWAPELPGHIKF